MVEKYNDCIFIDGATKEVLIEARNFLHKGYQLISHPLTGSLKTMVSPIRSIIIGEREEKIDILQLEAIESSIIKLDKHITDKEVDFRHNEDFKKLDYYLLKSALSENNL